MNLDFQPATYSAAYSAIPIKVSSTSLDTSEDFNYLIKIIYDERTVTDVVTYALSGNIYSKVTVSATHSYVVGDSLILDDSYNSDAYTGIYIIKKILNSTQFVIDLTLGAAFGSNDSRIYKFIPYKWVIDENGDGKGLLNNVLKDKVRHTLQDVNEIYSATPSKFEYKLMIGEEYEYSFEFTDNGSFYGSYGYGLPGCVSFYNPGLTSTDGIPFQVGDEVLVEQELFEWPYYDNAFSGGNVEFVSNNIHSFLAGQQITVTGQVSQPSWNGPQVVKAVTGTGSLTIFKAHTSTPTEGGIITGVPRPTYNKVCNITDINYSGATYGVVISVNVGFAGASQPIGGTIKYVNKLTRDINNIVSSKPYWAFDAGLKKLNYNFNGYDKYVIQSRSSSLNNLSTILNGAVLGIGATRYRVEDSSKFWILAHVYNTTYAYFPIYRFYDSTDTEISAMGMTNSSGNLQDYYIPGGLNQINASTNLYLISGATLSTVLDQVDNYTISASTRTRAIRFQLNRDCSNYDLYHVLWKDRLGSLITYPFKYISTKGTEVENKTFYNEEEKWTDTTFGYDTFGTGEQQYYSRNRQRVTINSGWLDPFENDLIQDMLESTQHYIQHPDGTLEAALLIEKEISYGSRDKDRVWQYQFTFKMSRNETRF